MAREYALYQRQRDTRLWFRVSVHGTDRALPSGSVTWCRRVYQDKLIDNAMGSYLVGYELRLRPVR